MENINESELESLIESGETILVDFWAPWCGGCKVLTPKLESIENDYPNVKFVKVNVDENSKMLTELNIRMIPTVIFYNDGRMVTEPIVGHKDMSTYTDILKTL